MEGRREVKKDQGGVFVLERVVVGPMVDVNDVGDHRPLGDKSPLVLVYEWTRDPLPPDSASRRQESVVGVGDGKWACVVAVVNVGAFLGGVAGFFGGDKPGWRG